MKGISHGCAVSYKSGKHKCAINNKPDTQTTSLFFCPTDDDQQVTVYRGGGGGGGVGRSERRGMRVVVFTVMGPAQVLGGGAPLLTTHCRNYCQHQPTIIGEVGELYCSKLVSIIRCSSSWMKSKQE